MGYGNLDKAKKFPVPVKWLESDDHVVVRQQRINNIREYKADPEGADLLKHNQPIQPYTRQQYAKLSVIANPDEVGEKVIRLTGFEQIGIAATLLHDSKKSATEDAIEQEEEDLDETDETLETDENGDQIPE